MILKFCARGECRLILVSVEFCARGKCRLIFLSVLVRQNANTEMRFFLTVSDVAAFAVMCPELWCSF